MSSEAERHPSGSPRPLIAHLPAPHDHFSPLTGSAIMTVIDGLAKSRIDMDHAVLVSQGTYPDRYQSADCIEYLPGPWITPQERVRDAVRARAGLGRPALSASYGDAFRQVPTSAAAVVVHNGPYIGKLSIGNSPAVLYAHNLVLSGHQLAVSRAIAGFDAIIAVSDFLANDLSNRIPRRSKIPIHTVLNGVDTSAFVPVDRPDRERTNVLFFGRVIHEKGPDLLLSALAKLQRSDVEARVLGSARFSAQQGPTPYQNALRDMAAEIRGGVDFQPFVDRSHIVRQLQWADIVVLPSRWKEPCGLALLEALSVGAAVICTRVGGMPEVAQNAALVVPKEDVNALADALDALISDRAMRRALGQRARARAKDLDWRTRTPDFERAMSAVIG